ncbi:GNAT family N-acetyltransferase [Neolewinella aurantiaca]|nr:GNAT family N-acetyltransferase [Neolewinella aurantiaca]
MIRPLTTSDLSAFLALRKQSWSTDPLSWDHDPGEVVDPEEWRPRMDAIDNERFILGYFLTEDRTEPQLAGIIGFSRFEKQKRRHRAMVWGVYVDPEARGRGAAKLLLEECLERARKMEGLHHLVLSVSNHAEAAIRLYTAAGFVEWGRETAAARTGEVFMDEIHMRFELSRTRQ